ncbi:MAG: radical SAM protein [Firmicutes bacterium]|nr:radical SAM protein [Bacillota bacterium]
MNFDVKQTVIGQERAECGLCFHKCVLGEEQVGFCGARINRGGSVVSLSYGQLTSLALDPIEKKPLRKFHPGSMILSAGSFGCNLKCDFCQNHRISMAEDVIDENGKSIVSRRKKSCFSDLEESAQDKYADAEAVGTVRILPSELVQKAESLKHIGNIGIAYTYNEPLVGYEFVRECAALAHEHGLLNVLVTNGTAEEKPWRELLAFIDAVNIDLKGFTPQWYRRLGGDLDNVKRSIEIASQICHVEITTLLIPEENDSIDEIRKMADWISSIDRDIPLHLSRFFPRYKMAERTPTPVDSIYRAAEEARKYLHNVYTGNC